MCQQTGAVDRHNFYADSDPNLHSDADPNPDLDKGHTTRFTNFTKSELLFVFYSNASLQHIVLSFSSKSKF
jgi:hypothetical protein